MGRGWVGVKKSYREYLKGTLSKQNNFLFKICFILNLILLGKNILLNAPVEKKV